MVGGFDGTRQLASVERYDTVHQTWEEVAPIKIARSALSLTVLDSQLYAMGGFDGHNFLSIVEVYDPELNRWLEGTPLTTGRSGHASAVIYQPSVASVYTDGSETTTDNDDSSKEPSSLPNKEQSPQAAGPSSSNSAGSNGFNSSPGTRCTHCDEDSKPNDIDEPKSESTNRTIQNISNLSKPQNRSDKIDFSIYQAMSKRIPDKVHKHLTEMFINDNPKKCKRKFCSQMIRYSPVSQFKKYINRYLANIVDNMSGRQHKVPKSNSLSTGLFYASRFVKFRFKRKYNYQNI